MNGDTLSTLRRWPITYTSRVVLIMRSRGASVEFEICNLYFDIHDRARRKVLYAVAALSKSSNVRAWNARTRIFF